MADGRKLSEAGRRMVAASLPENREARGETGRVAVESLMSSDDVVSEVDVVDGFIITSEVRVTERDHVSLVRKGERPHAGHHVALSTPPRQALAEARAALKGRKGKSRILLKKKVARLERIVALAETPRTWPSMPVLPVLPAPRARVWAPIRQVDYYGGGVRS